ncbi:MAG: hypothetical protein LW636_08170 [Planctomycetaceae bacterium]|nr:hypothetical protein [Planctomycetaceae bacterium]
MENEAGDMTREGHRVRESRAAQVLYAVRSTFTDAAVRAEFLAWLEGGHLADVVRAGAIDAEVVELPLGPEAPVGALADVETRYHFASAAAFAAYEQGPAVPLRAEGKAKFPPERGIVMSRSVAVSRARFAY